MGWRKGLPSAHRPAASQSYPPAPSLCPLPVHGQTSQEPQLPPPPWAPHLTGHVDFKVRGTLPRRVLPLRQGPCRIQRLPAPGQLGGIVLDVRQHAPPSPKLRPPKSLGALSAGGGGGGRVCQQTGKPRPGSGPGTCMFTAKYEFEMCKIEPAMPVTGCNMGCGGPCIPCAGGPPSHITATAVPQVWGPLPGF